MTNRQIENWVSAAACIKIMSENVRTAMDSYMDRIGLTIEQFMKLPHTQKEKANIAWRNSPEYAKINNVL